LAVAFGTQNLIKDFFTGFLLLLEDQYGVNDYVTVGGISGVVQRITLRVTVLRDLDGTTHFIPHGTITTVSNMTHDGSRAVFAVTVPVKEDVDRTIAILAELGKALRQDSVYGKWILSDPEMLGVDQLGDSTVVIKFFLETVLLKQWDVKRELLRRIKNQLDEMRKVEPNASISAVSGNSSG
jgi:small-conductance mechanosensitive channel